MFKLFKTNCDLAVVAVSLLCRATRIAYQALSWILHPSITVTIHLLMYICSPILGIPLYRVLEQLVGQLHWSLLKHLRLAD